LGTFNKVSKNYRLSFETIALAEAIAEKNRISETHVIESAVSEFANLELTAEEREAAVMKKVKEILEKKKD